MNFPFICSNIPAVPAYGVYISQLIRYSRVCGSYQDVLDICQQWSYWIKTSYWLNWSHHCESCMVTTMTWVTVMEYLYHEFMTYHRVCKYINTTGATSGAGTANPSGALEFTSGFMWGSCYPIFSFICMFCRSLFVLLSFFICPLCCLFFFDIRILITPLVSQSVIFFQNFYM